MIDSSAIHRVDFFSVACARLLVTGAVVGLAACAERAPEPSTATAEIIVPHVYTRPPLPTASYDVPATNVVHVRQPGATVAGATDNAAPTFGTLRDALDFVNAPAQRGVPWTIVMHAGVYREGELDILRPDVTIQRAGTEPVSLYGSRQLTFPAMGPFTATVSADELAYLDLPCAEVDPNEPVPELGATVALGVTSAGVPLRRIAPGTPPQAGEYSLANGLLTVHDNTPVELATKSYAIKALVSNVKIAGLDIENYATCAVSWQRTVNGHSYWKAAVLFGSTDASGMVLENCTVANNAASAVAAVHAHDVRLSGNVIVNNGWNGAHAHASRGLIVTGNHISFNNVRHWSNFVDAGMKVTNIANGVVFGNVFEHNATSGFWCDQGCGSTDPSSRWFVIARNLVRFNDKTGIFYEISHHGAIASNLVHDNGASGIAAFGSRNLRIWNNTVVDNTLDLAGLGGYHAGIATIDDARCAAGDMVPGGMPCTERNGLKPVAADTGDHCEPHTLGELANTCNAEGVSIVNNIVGGAAPGRPLLNVEDDNASFYGAKRIILREDYQAYWRSSAPASPPLIRWQLAAGNHATPYSTLARLLQAFAQDADHLAYEANSVERTTPAPPFFIDYAGKNFVQKPTSELVSGVGAPLPIEVLRAVYWPALTPAQPSPRIGAIEWADKPACTLTAPVYHRSHPNGDHLLTTSLEEANAAPGYTANHGIAFTASAAAQPGLVPVYRLLNPTSHQHFWTSSESEKNAAQTFFGFTVDENIGFYAAPTAGPCVVGVHRLQSAGKHVYTVVAAERDLLVAAGGGDEGIRFYATAP